MEKSPSEANSHSASQEILLLWDSNVHYRVHNSPLSEALWVFTVRSRTTPKLENHPLSPVRDCLFNIFAAYPSCLVAVSSIRNPRMRYAVVVGTHIT